ncbi:MAG: hypothetical protein AAGI10_12430 [Pseudomonadota bacterium]
MTTTATSSKLVPQVLNKVSRMHPSLVGLSDKILGLATDALRRANTDAVFFDPGMEHRQTLAPLAAAHAGELVLKALIAREHPLLLFKNLGEKSTNDEINLDWLLAHGRTHDFSRLPSVLWASAGIELPNLDSFKRIAKRRNQVQHFLDNSQGDVQQECLDFIYGNLDPLLDEHFGLCACEYHEDQFPDYVIGCLLAHEIRFSVPTDLQLSEISPSEYLDNCSKNYRNWVEAHLVATSE